uniref:Uncharacterized protein n=1 Tax=Arundo donax TaxID=35708 RepID=A0A0A9EI90_ARUDO
MLILILQLTKISGSTSSSMHC